MSEAAQYVAHAALLVPRQKEHERNLKAHFKANKHVFGWQVFVFKQVYRVKEGMNLFPLSLCYSHAGCRILTSHVNTAETFNMYRTDKMQIMDFLFREYQI